MINSFSINNREYPNIIKNISVVIYLDGIQKKYLDEASKANLTPNLDKIIKKREYLIAHRAIPSFANPNIINKKQLKYLTYQIVNLLIIKIPYLWSFSSS